VNAAAGETAVHRIPAIALAARLATAWMAASSPNAEPRERLGCELGDGGALGGLGGPDADPGEDEAAGEQCNALAAEREPDVGEQETAEACGQDCEHSAAIAGMACGDAGERRGEVVARVEHQRELPTRVVVLPDGSTAFSFTMFQGPDMPDELFESQHESLKRECTNIQATFAA
jgi:hypothetical protein